MSVLLIDNECSPPFIYDLWSLLIFEIRCSDLSCGIKLESCTTRTRLAPPTAPPSHEYTVLKVLCIKPPILALSDSKCSTSLSSLQSNVQVLAFLFSLCCFSGKRRPFRLGNKADCQAVVAGRRDVFVYTHLPIAGISCLAFCRCLVWLRVRNEDQTLPAMQ